MTLTKSDKERIATATQKVNKSLQDVMQILANVVNHESPKDIAKKPKDPNAPKRNLSSFMLYYQSARIEELKKNPDLKATDIAKLVGEKWRSLSDKEKQPFVKQAAKEKARFDKEIMAYEDKQHKRKAEEEVDDQVPTKRKAEKKKSKKSSESKKKSKQ